MQAFFLQTVTFQNKTYASKKKKIWDRRSMWNVNDPRLFWNRAQDEGFLKQSRTNQIGPLENKDSISNCAHGLIQRNTQISIFNRSQGRAHFACILRCDTRLFLLLSVPAVSRFNKSCENLDDNTCRQNQPGCPLSEWFRKIREADLSKLANKIIW